MAGRVNTGGWGTARIKQVAACHPSARHYAKGLCRRCYRNTPEFRAKRDAYYRANPEQWKRHGQSARERRVREQLLYGVAAATIDAMLIAQGHRCAICRRPPGKRGLGVDHDHATGQVRGMLCGPCNMALGGFRDNPEFCEHAADYLRRYSVPAASSAA